MNRRPRLERIEKQVEALPPSGAAIIRRLDSLPDGAERQQAIRDLSDDELRAVKKDTEIELGFSLSDLSDEEIESLCRGEDSAIQRVIDRACGYEQKTET
jgi:hypothetical protein